MESHRFLVLSCILLSLGILSSPVQCDVDFLTGTTTIIYSIDPRPDGSYFALDILVSRNQSALTLNINYDVADPGPTCFVEVVKSGSVTAASNISYWTKPCPRTPQPVPSQGFWCSFNFTNGGDMLLRSGPNITQMYEVGTLLWSSNTSGMGAVRLDLLDSDPEGLGNLVLYGANNETVWQNIANNPASQDYQCALSPSPAPSAAPLLAPTPAGAPFSTAAPAPTTGG